MSILARKIDKKWLVGFIATFICCAFYAALFSFKTMPVSEGWYTEYAWQINHGKLPYRDFEYLFFPLYMFIIAGFTKIFGYSIIALRILGIFVFGISGAVLYCIITKIFDNFTAVIAAVIGMLFLQSENAQIFYDYIRFHDLFAFCTTYFLVELTEKGICKNFDSERVSKVIVYFMRYLVPGLLLFSGILGVCKYPFDANHKKFIFLAALIIIATLSILIPLFFARTRSYFSAPSTAILCGVFVSLECMVKQSNGVLMIVFACIYINYCAFAFRKDIQNRKYFLNSFIGIGYGIVFAFSILLIYLLATNSLTEFVSCCFKSALSAKGGLGTTLFNWIPSAWNSFWHEKNLIIIIALIIYIGLMGIKQGGLVKQYIKKRYVWLSCIVILLIEMIYVFSAEYALKAYNNYNRSLPAVAFFVCLIVFVIFAIYILVMSLMKRDVHPFVERYFILFPVLGVVFAQGYGSGMSGGLASSQTAIGLAIVVAMCVHPLVQSKQILVTVGTLLYLLTLTASFAGVKAVQTYDWWGLTQDSIELHTKTVNVPLLNGLKVRDTEKTCYETIYHDIINNTEVGDEIFTFPHCPIFYTMTDRHSVTYSKVQWFDVSSNYSIENDIVALKDNLPKMIIYVTLPDWVYEGHESSFGAYQTRSMRDFLMNDLIPNYNYALVNTLDLGNGYYISSYLLQP